MEKHVIAVGATLKQKIGYLEESLKELRVKAKIAPCDVKSGVSDQPLSSAETKKGSLNRARRALAVSKAADMALGIEVGYHKTKDGYEMFCWASIADGKRKIVSRQSHTFLLPRYHQNILKKGLYLGDNLDGYDKKNDQPLRKYVSDIIRYRKPFIETAIKNALLGYLTESFSD